MRLRPILMTTAAMVVGIAPLIFAHGAGAVSRFNIGVTIFFGMAIGTLFTLFVTPGGLHLPRPRPRGADGEGEGARASQGRGRVLSERRTGALFQRLRLACSTSFAGLRNGDEAGLAPWRLERLCQSSSGSERNSWTGGSFPLRRDRPIDLIASLSPLGITEMKRLINRFFRPSDTTSSNSAAARSPSRRRKLRRDP